MRIHISLTIKDLSRSTAFYSALFGQTTSKLKPGYANYRLDQPPIHLALVEGRGLKGLGPGHLGLELPDHEALADWRTRLEDAGVPFETEDQAQCCFATADKLWLTDPDGYRWELWVRTGEYEAISAPAEPTTKTNSKPACCA